MTKNNKDSAPNTAQGHHIEKYLYAFANLDDVATFVRTQVIAEDQGKFQALKAKWEALQPGIAQMIEAEAGIAGSIKRAQIPTEAHANVTAIIEDDLFRKTFAGPLSIEMVEVDKLMAPQKMVNVDYVKSLEGGISTKPGAKELVDYCLGFDREKAPVSHLEVGPGQHAFSSVNTDLRFLGGFLKPLSDEDKTLAALGGTPVAAVIGFVGYGLDTINVIEADGKYILNNGFHRAYTLRKKGIEMIPVVIQHKQNVARDMPQHIYGLPREYFLQHPRPVLMKDFFNDDYTAELKVKNRLKTITAQIQSAHIDVPI